MPAAAMPTARQRWLRRLGIDLLVSFALLVFAVPLWAQQLATIPPLDGPVIDTTGTLDAATRQHLTQQALALQQRKGSQLQVLLVPTTAPETIEQYGVRAFEQYRIGRKGVDDAVLLLVAKDDRQVRIEVGYGLEGAIPDITAGRVVAEYIVPKFREGDYAGGVVDATAQLVKLIDGEPLPEPMTRQGGEYDSGGSVMFALIAAWFVALFVRGILGRTPVGVRGIATALASGGTAWVISSLLAVGGMGLFLGLLLGLSRGGGSSGGGGRYVRHSRVGSWGGGPWIGGGGSGGGGFGGGGGWSGGGGMSGGGGASGSW